MHAQETLDNFFSIVETFKLCLTNHKITQNYRRVKAGMDLWKSPFVSLNYKGFLFFLFLQLKILLILTWYNTDNTMSNCQIMIILAMLLDSNKTFSEPLYIVRL